MNQALHSEPEPALFNHSATGEPVPSAEVARFVRTVQTPKHPARFRVIEYGEKVTAQIYDGSDRAKADAQWAKVKHGIYLGVDEDHAWTAIEKR